MRMIIAAFVGSTRFNKGWVLHGAFLLLFVAFIAFLYGCICGNRTVFKNENYLKRLLVSLRQYQTKALFLLNGGHRSECQAEALGQTLAASFCDLRRIG